MTGERNTKCSKQMEGSNQHWTPSEDGFLLDRKA